MTPSKVRRMRGAILTILCGNHNRQGERLDDVQIGSALISLLYDPSPNEVITVLQDLKDREYVRFIPRRNTITGRIELHLVEITARGRDLVEESVKPDPAVEL